MGLLNAWMESLDYDFKVLDLCTRHQSPHSSCMKCLDVCTYEAITFVDEKPYIFNEKCKECGYCITECPVQAIEGFIPKRTIIQELMVVTDEHPPSIKELLVFFKKGITGIIYEQEELNSNWQQTIEETNKRLVELGETPFSIQHKKIELKEETFSRREMFTFWKKEAQSTIKQMTPAKWRFNHKETDLAKLYPNYQFHELTVDLRKCTLCKACQMLCQKNGLRINETSFAISAQSCSGCMLCQDICPEKAITLEERIIPTKEIVHYLYTKKCTNCKNIFQTLIEHDEKCVMCKKREEFGRFLS